MPVRIITDSTSDIPPEIAKELGIIVVPEYLIFGDKCYKDRVDISEDEFYDKLVNGHLQPTTSQPTPQDFIEVFKETAKDADGIVSIHISSLLSGTVNSAEQAAKTASDDCPVEVIDSRLVAIPLGMVVMEVAKMAQAGKGVKEIAEAAQNMISNVKLLIMFDTLEYLSRGGRIGKAKALLGSLLNVKPIITIKDGELVPIAQVRSKAKGKEKLMDFYHSLSGIEDLYVIYSSTNEEAKELASSLEKSYGKAVKLARLGPVVGAHAGPGVLAVAARVKG